jgi:DNA mismatch endonuclease (patch repair protein)
MLGNRSESAVERALRSELHKRGLRFRKHYSPVPGLRCRADVAFPRERVAVFIDGCFWHRCPIHGSSPKANGAWWRTKLDANVARDQRNNAALDEDGWLVVRMWEHEDLNDMVLAVCAVVQKRRDPLLARCALDDDGAQEAHTSTSR